MKKSDFDLNTEARYSFQASRKNPNRKGVAGQVFPALAGRR